MSLSKIMADRMMLDIRALLLSLEFTNFALQKKERDLKYKGKQVLEAAKEDIQNFAEDSIMADNLSTYYGYSIDKERVKFTEVVEKIENGLFDNARSMIDDLNKQIEEKLSENPRERVT